MKTLLIIPAYNEEESLQNTVESIRTAAPHVDYLVVNDGSTDNTVLVCRQNNYPFLDLPTNLGLSGAFQAGMKYASRHNYDCAIQFDADGQHLPQYIAPLEDAIQNADIAIGSRYITSKRRPSLRGFGSALIKGAIRLTTGQRITDPTSGMRAFNKRMIRAMASGVNFGPEPDTIAFLIKRARANVIEIPVQMQDRQAGTSYFNIWGSAMYMLRMSISILFIQFFRKDADGFIAPSQRSAN